MTIQNILARFQRLTLATIFIVSLLAIMAVLVTPTQTKAQTGITKIGQIGGYTSPPLDFPNSVRFDATGNLFVVNRNQDEIIKYNSNYNYQSKFGEDGSGNGQFGEAINIAFDAAGSIYVVDRNNHRIQKFDTQGNYVSQFGSQGSGDGEFNAPDGIAIDSSDNIYIVDSNNHRIQKFDTQGNYVSQFGSQGSGNGEFKVPQTIAVDTSGNVYVTDGDNYRVQVFDSNGQYLSQFGSQGSGDGQFAEIYGIALDNSNNIYVSDPGNDRLQIFNNSGQYLSQFGSQGSGDGQFEYPREITIDSENNIIIADSNNDRVQKCTTAGNCQSIIDNYNFNPFIAYEVEVGNNQVFAPNVNNQSQSGMIVSNLTGKSKVVWPPTDSIDYMVTTSPNYVYTIAAFDGDGFKFKKMNYSGQTLSTWDVPGLGYGIAADSQDNLYWFNQGASQIIKYSSNGTILNQFGSEGTGDGQFALINEGPSFLANDTQDNLYVSDTFNHRIQKFDSNGNFLMKFGSEGTGQGEFTYVGGSAINSNGDIYVSDYAGNNSRIQKFDSNGNFVSEYIADPEMIFGDARFGPYGLSVAPNGRLFVASPDSASIDILCDHDVSTDGCQSLGTEGGDNNNSPITDINADGILDSQQPYVQALSSPDTNTPIGLEVSDDCTFTDATISPESNQTVADSAYSYPNGLVSFTADCGTPGYTTTVTLYYYDTPKDNLTLRKYNPNSNAYFSLTGQYGATLEQTTLNNRTVTMASYQITDGGDLDQDSLVNGTIVDPVGLAKTKTTAPDTGLQTHWLLKLKQD